MSRRAIKRRQITGRAPIFCTLIRRIRAELHAGIAIDGGRDGGAARKETRSNSLGASN